MPIHMRYLIVFFFMKFKFLIFLALLAFIANPSLADKGNNDLSFYAGTFDIIDEECDDQTTLFGIEHRNPNLFRNTFLGKFSPVSGGSVSYTHLTLPTTVIV